MNNRHENQQRRQLLLTIVSRSGAEELFSFLQRFHRRPFRSLAQVLSYDGVIDDQIDFIDCVTTNYNVTPLIIAAGKGSFEKTKILLVHGANPNQQCLTGDTALSLAVHRQKYQIVELLLQYRANPNIPNQTGKTPLHRAAALYIDEHANQIRTLLLHGADPKLEDRNRRIPLFEAALANKPEITAILLSHDRTLVKRAYQAAAISARLGHDRCLETLLNFGMDPNISDRTRTTPLHIAVRSLKLSTARILVSRGADPYIANIRNETPLTIVEYLPLDQQQSFYNVLRHTPRDDLTDHQKYTTGVTSVTDISSIYPLLRSHQNWTLDSDEFRSPTEVNSSVQNLLDISSGTYWCSTKNKNAWVIFDLKYQHSISGMRISGCDNHSSPRNGHIDVSNAFNGPWLKVQDFVCPMSRNRTDVYFSLLKTRFIRVTITDNYGGDDIRIQSIGFFGVEMRLVNLLREHKLEKSLQTLLANGINDLATLDEQRDEILNSSDKYLGVNDHFEFIRLIESLRSPKFTYLEWFNAPQSTVIAGEKLQTFSAAAAEGLTDRVKLEEKPETSQLIRTVFMRDLEPIQGRSLVDFPDYVIKEPGQYKVRVVSVESPHIHTPWQDIVVGAKPTTVPNSIIDVPVKPPVQVPPFSPQTDLDFNVIDENKNRPYPHQGKIEGEGGNTMFGNNDSQRSKLVNKSTQSEEKSTRNMGTMHEPVQTRNSGNEVQPQSSSTQTSFPSKGKSPKRPIFTFIERLEPPSSPIHDPSCQHLPYQPKCAEYRYISLSPPLYQHDYIYDGQYPCSTSQPKEPTYHHATVSEYYEHSPRICPCSPPPITYRLVATTKMQRSRTSSPQYRSCKSSPANRTHSPIASHRVRCLSSSRRPRSATPRHRPHMYSQETDTSLDAMKQVHHTGVQYELPSTQEKGTTPSFRIKRSTAIHRPTTTDTSSYCQRRPPVSHSTLIKDYDRPRKHCVQPTFDDDQIEYYDPLDDEEEEKYDSPSMHDQSTMAELIVCLDHYTQCESQPFMADRYIQTTPLADENEYGNPYEYEEESYIRQLPGTGSISIRQPHIVQPDSLPRRRIRQPSPTRPKHDGLDYTGNNLELPLHHCRQLQTPPLRDSPLLNIGSEKYLDQPIATEFVTPFETRFIYESDSASTIGSRRNGSYVVPVANLSRNQLFRRSPVHQSKSNSNFYLSNGPTRPINSSFRIDITADES